MASNSRDPGEGPSNKRPRIKFIPRTNYETSESDDDEGNRRFRLRPDYRNNERHSYTSSSSGSHHNTNIEQNEDSMDGPCLANLDRDAYRNLREIGAHAILSSLKPKIDELLATKYTPIIEDSRALYEQLDYIIQLRFTPKLLKNVQVLSDMIKNYRKEYNAESDELLVHIICEGMMVSILQRGRNRAGGQGAAEPVQKVPSQNFWGALEKLLNEIRLETRENEQAICGDAAASGDSYDDIAMETADVQPNAKQSPRDGAICLGSIKKSDTEEQMDNSAEYITVDDDSDAAVEEDDVVNAAPDAEDNKNENLDNASATTSSVENGNDGMAVENQYDVVDIVSDSEDDCVEVTEEPQSARNDIPTCSRPVVTKDEINITLCEILFREMRHLLSFVADKPAKFKKTYIDLSKILIHRRLLKILNGNFEQLDDIIKKYKTLFPEETNCQLAYIIIYHINEIAENVSTEDTFVNKAGTSKEQVKTEGANKKVVHELSDDTSSDRKPVNQMMNTARKIECDFAETLEEMEEENLQQNVEEVNEDDDSSQQDDSSAESNNAESTVQDNQNRNEVAAPNNGVNSEFSSVIIESITNNLINIIYSCVREAAAEMEGEEDDEDDEDDEENNKD